MAIVPERMAAVILAAGQSRRFGAEDKIAAELKGRPLGLHVADILAPLPFAARFAVIQENDPGFAPSGYTLLINRSPELGMSHSLKLAIAAAAGANVDAALVLLGDMPCVPVRHIEALMAGFSGAILGTRGARHVSPPAIFPRDSFALLMSFQGDVGARMLLRTAAALDAPDQWLADVDTPEDLARLS